ncbi:unnamed protein product [Kuraishia capsulata CBS 1993]|uniref:Anaphase-promoting complex subunit 4-like WD40 domain-containing protein n=1 Tax=Kuraishia capsulata CBS 1993 TaxID=1382522 RepID=W6MSS5_9ASCO|nr:uncharacterized protein KUCA_T00005762001 [Kuraishia capsulata CBS 1993]CDK29769.1 unnamed protein product [Kuraishia capsulata CBS 1993]
MATRSIPEDSFKDWKAFELPDASLGKDTRVITIQWNTKGTRLAYAKTDKSLKIWRLSNFTCSPVATLANCHDAPVESISWDPTNELRLATVARGSIVKVWELSNNGHNLLHSIRLNSKDENNLVVFSPCGSFLAVVNRAGNVSILDATNGFELLHRIDHAKEHVYDLAWAGPGAFLAALSTGDVRLYRFDPGYNGIELVHTLKGHQSAATSVRCDPRGRYVAIGTNEGTVSLWDTQHLISVGTITGVDEPIGSIEFSPDGKYMAVTYEYDSPGRIFILDGLREVHQISQCVGGNTIPQAKFSPTHPFVVCSGDLLHGKCALMGVRLVVK